MAIKLMYALTLGVFLVKALLVLGVLLLPYFVWRIHANLKQATATIEQKASDLFMTVSNMELELSEIRELVAGEDPTIETLEARQEIRKAARDYWHSRAGRSTQNQNSNHSPNHQPGQPAPGLFQ